MYSRQVFLDQLLDQLLAGLQLKIVRIDRVRLLQDEFHALSLV